MELHPTSKRNHKLMRLQAFWGGAANGAWVIFAIPFLLRLDASITLISIYVALTSLGPLLIGPIAVANLRNRAQQRRCPGDFRPQRRITGDRRGDQFFHQSQRPL